MAEGSAQRQRGKRRTVAAALVAVVGMLGLVAYSPTLYRIFCAVTGYGGAVAQAKQVAVDKDEAASGKRMTVRFDANVDPGFPWSFRPEERSVEVTVGEPVTIHYRATNMSNEPLIGQATFNVTPFKAAPHFFKVECFCFANQKLGPTETARMPVMFYLDPAILEDPETQELGTVTLSYTFYPKPGDAQKVAGTRDLKDASENRQQELKGADELEFVNDARRR